MASMAGFTKLAHIVILIGLMFTCFIQQKERMINLEQNKYNQHYIVVLALFILLKDKEKGKQALPDQQKHHVIVKLL